MLYWFGASAEGNLLGITDISYEQPYIYIVKTNLKPMHQGLWDAYVRFIDAANDIPRPGDVLVNYIQKLNKSSAEFQKDAPDEPSIRNKILANVEKIRE